MSFSPEQQEQLNTMLDSKLVTLLGQVVETFDERMEKQRRDNSKQTEGFLNSFITEKLPEVLSERLMPIQKNLEFLESVKTEWEKEEEESNLSQQVSNNNEEQTQRNPNHQQQSNSSSVASSEMIALQRRLEEMKGQLDKTEKLAQEERGKREKAEGESRKQEMYNSAVESIGRHNKDNPNLSILPGREKQLLTLLQSDGLLIEENGGFRVKTRDRYGDEVLIPFQDSIPSLLEKEYSHFVSPRSGTGTGASQGTNNSNGSFSIGNLSPEEILNRAKSDGDNYENLVRELEKQIS